MTNEDILQLAKTSGFDRFQRRKYDGKSDYGIQWECWEEQLLKFARAIYDKGWDDRHSATQFAISFDEHLGY